MTLIVNIQNNIQSNIFRDSLKGERWKQTRRRLEPTHVVSVDGPSSESPRPISPFAAFHLQRTPPSLHHNPVFGPRQARPLSHDQGFLQARPLHAQRPRKHVLPVRRPDHRPPGVRQNARERCRNLDYTRRRVFSSRVLRQSVGCVQGSKKRWRWP